MMIEADVMLGTVAGSTSAEKNVPIMSHPPEKTSDLTFKEFVETTIEVSEFKGLHYKKLTLRCFFQAVDDKDLKKGNIM